MGTVTRPGENRPLAHPHSRVYKALKGPGPRCVCSACREPPGRTGAGRPPSCLVPCGISWGSLWPPARGLDCCRQGSCAAPTMQLERGTETQPLCRADVTCSWDPVVSAPSPGDGSHPQAKSWPADSGQKGEMGATTCRGGTRCVRALASRASPHAAHMGNRGMGPSHSSKPDGTGCPVVQTSPPSQRERWGCPQAQVGSPGLHFSPWGTGQEGQVQIKRQTQRVAGWEGGETRRGGAQRDSGGKGAGEARRAPGPAAKAPLDTPVPRPVPGLGTALGDGDPGKPATLSPARRPL